MMRLRHRSQHAASQEAHPQALWQRDLDWGDAVIPQFRFAAWKRQERGAAPGLHVVSVADDRSAVVDVPAVGKIKMRTRRYQEVEVGHRAVLPDEGTAAPARVTGFPDNLSFVVEPERDAKGIPRQRAQVRHHPALPQEGVKSCVPRQAREADDLFAVVDCGSAVELSAAKIAQVDG